jgi:hypothetical protein
MNIISPQLGSSLLSNDKWRPFCDTPPWIQGSVQFDVTISLCGPVTLLLVACDLRYARTCQRACPHTHTDLSSVVLRQNKLSSRSSSASLAIADRPAWSVGYCCSYKSEQVTFRDTLLFTTAHESAEQSSTLCRLTVELHAA